MCCYLEPFSTSADLGMFPIKKLPARGLTNNMRSINHSSLLSPPLLLSPPTPLYSLLLSPSLLTPRIPPSIETDVMFAKDREELSLASPSDEVVHALVHGGLHEPLLLRYPHYLLHLLRGIVRYSKLTIESEGEWEGEWKGECESWRESGRVGVERGVERVPFQSDLFCTPR